MLLKLISCGSLALVSVLVATLLKGLQQHNQRIHALQERIDQLEERTPNHAQSDLLSQQMGLMQERIDAFAAMRTSPPHPFTASPLAFGRMKRCKSTNKTRTGRIDTTDPAATIRQSNEKLLDNCCRPKGSV